MRKRLNLQARGPASLACREVLDYAGDHSFFAPSFPGKARTMKIVGFETIPGQRALQACRAQLARAARRRQRRRSSSSPPIPASSAGARAAAAPTPPRSRRRVQAMAPLRRSAAIRGTREAIARDVYKHGLWDYRVRPAISPSPASTWRSGTSAARIAASRSTGCSAARCARRSTTSTTSPWARPRSVAAQCRDGVARGYRCFYLKVGVDAAREEAMLAAIRETIGPSGKIRIDANEAWSVPEAARLLNRWNDTLRHRLRRGAGARLPAAPDAGAEAARRRWRSAPMRGSAARPTCCAPSRRGRPTCSASPATGSAACAASTRLSHLAHLNGMKVCKHTHGELGIAAAAGQHMLLTLPNAIDGAQQTAAMMDGRHPDRAPADRRRPALGPHRAARPRHRGRRGTSSRTIARPIAATASSCPTARDGGAASRRPSLPA